MIIKNFAIITILFLANLTSISAQDSGKTKMVEPKTIENKKVENNLEREKFDPTRNASADLADAVTQAQTSGKRIILDVGGEWCIWCVITDKFFIANSDLAKLRDENFIWLKINFSEENKNEEFLATYPKVTGYPHLFVLDENGKLLHSQNTAELEKGKSYDLAVYMDFLKKWSPTKASDSLGKQN